MNEIKINLGVLFLFISKKVPETKARLIIEKIKRETRKNKINIEKLRDTLKRDEFNLLESYLSERLEVAKYFSIEEKNVVYIKIANNKQLEKND